jgi:hypothetical protein
MSTAEPLPRPDWRDSVALAADLALLGIVVTLACLPVVTAGGALAAASTAANRVCTDRTFPPPRELGRTFLRGLLPGLGAVATAVAAGALIAIDLRAIASGQVPGGVPVLVATIAVTAAAAALALISLVRLGSTGGGGWIPALVWSWHLLLARPLVVAAVLVTVALPVLLASTIPVTTPLLAGFALFALHVAVRRLSSADPRDHELRDATETLETPRRP